MIDFEFGVDNEIKQEYLSKKPTSTARSNAFILRSADSYEQSIGKPIYNLSHSELKEMRSVMFNNSTTGSIVKNMSILKKYIDFCIEKRLVPHSENRLALFTIQDAKKEVSRQAMLKQYTDKKKVREYQDLLINEQDKLLLELSYFGIIGEGIMNLTMNDVDKVNKRVYFKKDSKSTKKQIVEVDEHTIDLIEDTFAQEYYMENNGEPTNNVRLGYEPKKARINEIELLVFRIPGKNKMKKFTASFLNQRMRNIKKFVGNEYMTYTTLYNSGIIEKLINIYDENRVVTNRDFDYIQAIYGYNISKQQNVKIMFEQYLRLLK